MASATATSPIIGMLPLVHHFTPQHPKEAPAVLDLCVRKRPPSPSYSYDYNSRSPGYPETCLSPAKSPSATSEYSDVSSSETRDWNANVSLEKRAKISRPFKAFPKDPLSMAFMSNVSDQLLGKDSAEAYADFREKMLIQVRATHNSSNKNMRRTQTQNVHNSDPSYWEKRRKNNEAAKRSRDARKAKEDEIAIRCAFLEQENVQLKCKIAALEREIERSRRIVYH